MQRRSLDGGIRSPFNDFLNSRNATRSLRLTYKPCWCVEFYSKQCSAHTGGPNSLTVSTGHAAMFSVATRLLLARQHCFRLPSRLRPMKLYAHNRESCLLRIVSLTMKPRYLLVFVFAPLICRLCAPNSEHSVAQHLSVIMALCLSDGSSGGGRGLLSSLHINLLLHFYSCRACLHFYVARRVRPPLALVHREVDVCVLCVVSRLTDELVAFNCYDQV